MPNGRSCPHGVRLLRKDLSLDGDSPMPAQQTQPRSRLLRRASEGVPRWRFFLRRSLQVLHTMLSLGGQAQDGARQGRMSRRYEEITQQMRLRLHRSRLWEKIFFLSCQMLCFFVFFASFRCVVTSLQEGLSVRPSVRPYVR